MTAEFGGDMVVAGNLGASTVEDEACAEGEALGGGAGVDELVQLLGFLVGEEQGGSLPGHGTTSVKGERVSRDNFPKE
jgi:hypothetical protein